MGWRNLNMPIYCVKVEFMSDAGVRVTLLGRRIPRDDNQIELITGRGRRYLFNPARLLLLQETTTEFHEARP